MDILWQDNSDAPCPGDIIYFNRDNKGGSGPQDGLADRVGIVEKVGEGMVHTVKGNSGDSCRENRYAIGHYEIYGDACLLKWPAADFSDWYIEQIEVTLRSRQAPPICFR